MSDIADVLALLNSEIDEIDSRGGIIPVDQRLDILASARKLVARVETHHDTQQRVLFGPIDAGVTRACLELGVLAELANAGLPVSLETLASRTGADPVLLRRLLRHQASILNITEAGVDLFEANNVTRNLILPTAEGTVLFGFEVGAPASLALSKFLAEHSWRNPQDPSDTPFNAGVGTKLSFWDYIQQNKTLSKRFLLNMESHRTILGSCFDHYDFGAELKPCDNQRAVFVDVGGGAGGHCIELLRTHPELQGNVILQDLPDTIASVDLPPRIEKMAHDFFTAQPIRGAKVYFLRAVLHDHPDERAIVILQHIADAMEPDSFLIMNELVVPAKKASSMVTQSDILMMMYMSAAERNEAQWDALLAQAGLRLTSCEIHVQGFGLSLMKATKR